MTRARRETFHLRYLHDSHTSVDVTASCLQLRKLKLNTVKLLSLEHIASERYIWDLNPGCEGTPEKSVFPLCAASFKESGRAGFAKGAALS